MTKRSKPYISRKKTQRPSFFPTIPKRLKKSFDQGEYLLDHLSAENIDRYSKAQKNLVDYFYDEYYYFASERGKRSAQIADALNKKTIKLDFEKHYRCVFSEYNHKPLSAAGSRINAIGGRFNFGTINNSFHPFCALYIGESISVARAEIRQKDPLFPERVTLEDFDGVSISDFRVHGSLSNVLDITDSSNLKPFLKIISKIEPPEGLAKKAILAGLVSGAQGIMKMSELEDALLLPNWRLSVTRFGIPSNSQSFGSLVKSSKIEAIRYRSKYQSGACFAIFPENLAPGSFISLSDKAAPNVITTLDANSFSGMI